MNDIAYRKHYYNMRKMLTNETDRKTRELLNNQIERELHYEKIEFDYDKYVYEFCGIEFKSLNALNDYFKHVIYILDQRMETYQLKCDDDELEYYMSKNLYEAIKKYSYQEDDFNNKW
jgi:hypothetical protein